MNSLQRIVVTGSAGHIGQAVVAALSARGHGVVGFDRRPTVGLPPECVVVGTCEDREVLSRALKGSQVLIHLAATPDDARYPRGPAPNDGDNFLTELVPNNIVAPYHVLETARRVGIRRVILASSGQVIDGHLRAGRIPVTPSSLPQPRYLYACTKVFLEALGQVYAKEHGLEVLAVRLGWCPRPGQEEEFCQSFHGRNVYLSPADAGRFFVAAVEVPTLPPFAIVYATSRPTDQCLYDLSATRELLGWEPQDRLIL
ncbi:MAG: NAD(P)-dependent oxidoreductase [Gemmataceae bacterium]|nr:NAD(P)-dependent oxidoreductase [Gemmata sp.]MDW8196108.1 NAD(P)-dependent oxidoreductase [Gemmataceae bacterium]